VSHMGAMSGGRYQTGISHRISDSHLDIFLGLSMLGSTRLLTVLTFAGMGTSTSSTLAMTRWLYGSHFANLWTYFQTLSLSVWKRCAPYLQERWGNEILTSSRQPR